MTCEGVGVVIIVRDKSLFLDTPFYSRGYVSAQEYCVVLGKPFRHDFCPFGW